MHHPANMDAREGRLLMENSPFKTFFEAHNGRPFPALGEEPPAPHKDWNFIIQDTLIAFVDRMHRSIFPPG